jgi:hypothetical protein
MKYIDCCKKYREDIISRFSPAKKIDNFFTKEEIEQLRLYQFQNSRRVKMQESSSNIQPLVDVGKMIYTLDFLKNKFKDLLGDFSKKHSGNYFISSKPHDVHTDLLTKDEGDWTDNLIPYKSVIIPLFLTKNTQAHTAFMHQRRIGYSVIFDRDYLSLDNSSCYEILREYDGLIDINGKPTDLKLNSSDWIREKYPQVTKKNFMGFSEEIILEQTVESLLVFDACQLHSSVIINNKPWIKNAINIQFYKEHAE